MARMAEDILYRGNRRWNGNWGHIWIDNDLIFELNAFELKVTAERDEVIIGQDADSKIVKLVGEGTMTLKRVFNRGYKNMIEQWNAGHDVRFTMVGSLKDPDMLHEGEERIEVQNCWLNELPILHFTKGEVVEDEVPFGFTPADLKYLSTVER